MKTASLAEVAELNPAGPRSGQILSETLVDFVPMASVVEDGTMLVREQRPYCEVSKGFTAFQRGDILIAKITPCFENNKITIADVQSDYAFGSTEFHVVRCSRNVLDPKYLLYFLRQDRVRHAGEQRMTGSAGQRRVPKGFLEGLQIPLPLIGEQRRLAAILDKANEQRRKRQDTLNNLENFSQAYFVEIFGDPVTNLMGWPVIPLGDLGNLERGVSKHRPRNDPSLLNGPYPLIQTGDIANCDGYVRKYSATYSEIGLRQSRLWPTGTLCITIAANIGKTGILSFDACFPDSVVGFTPGHSVRTAYVQCWMSFIQSKLEAAAPEFAQKNINLAILRELKIPLPPAALQDEFVRVTNEVNKLKSLYRAHLDKLEALFYSLQHLAFNGELTSKGTERELAMAGG